MLLFNESHNGVKLHPLNTIWRPGKAFPIGVHRSDGLLFCWLAHFPWISEMTFIKPRELDPNNSNQLLPFEDLARVKVFHRFEEALKQPLECKVLSLRPDAPPPRLLTCPVFRGTYIYHRLQIVRKMKITEIRLISVICTPEREMFGQVGGGFGVHSLLLHSLAKDQSR